MIGETLFLMLLGHCLADYAFQPASTAFNKKKKDSEGFVYCAQHCTFYTFIVLIMMSFSLDFRILTDSMSSGYFALMLLMIFFSHYIIDRYHFVEWWVDKMKIRSWNTHIFMNKENLSTPESINLSFGSIVYVMIDNTIHLLLMYLTFKYFYSII